jgi:hypothetical protein
MDGHPGVGRLVLYTTSSGAINCEYSFKFLCAATRARSVRDDTKTGFPSTTLIIVVVGVMDLSSKPDAFSSDRDWLLVRSWPPWKVSIVILMSLDRDGALPAENHAVSNQ